MTGLPASAGLWMLLLLGIAILWTGLPVWALLLGCSSLFAAIGLATGVIDAGILGAVPARLVGLLEHDLLQALPLYVFVGVLLQRLTVADAMFSLLERGFRRSGSGASLAAMGVGALIAPMNGSVASSSALLSRLIAPRLAHLSPERGIALASVAATIGVVVPPSLVLILLGDAMLRAHTEARNVAAAGSALASQRVVNTQDVLHAALLPALAVLMLWMLVAWWQGRKTQNLEPKQADAGVEWRSNAIGLIAIAAIALLLASVFTGKMFAVEAAATGGCLLVLATLASRSLRLAQWQAVLQDTLALSGALIALLVGASTFSLVFRAFGTDQWLALVMGALPGGNFAVALLLLLLVALCAWVLDAFEMVFVIVPILAPLLIARLGDAQQAAVLLLLVLQLGFLIPPMGYAVTMARASGGFAQTSTRRVLKALWPYAGVQLCVIAMIFVAPQVVHVLDAPAGVQAPEAVSEQDLVRQMEDMARQPAAEDPAPAATESAPPKSAKPTNDRASKKP